MQELITFVVDFVTEQGGETTYRELYDAVNESNHNQGNLYDALQRAEAQGELHQQVERVEGQLRPVHFVRVGTRPVKEE